MATSAGRCGADGASAVRSAPAASASASRHRGLRPIMLAKP